MRFPHCTIGRLFDENPSRCHKFFGKQYSDMGFLASFAEASKIFDSIGRSGIK